MNDIERVGLVLMRMLRGRWWCGGIEIYRVVVRKIGGVAKGMGAGSRYGRLASTIVGKRVEWGRPEWGRRRIIA